MSVVSCEAYTYKVKSYINCTILLGKLQSAETCRVSLDISRVGNIWHITFGKCVFSFINFPEIVTISVKIWSESLWATGCCAVIKTQSTCCVLPPLMAHAAACAQTGSFFPLIHFPSPVCLNIYFQASVLLALLNIEMRHFQISFLLKNTEDEKDILGPGQCETKIDWGGESWERWRGVEGLMSCDVDEFVSTGRFTRLWKDSGFWHRETLKL